VEGSHANLRRISAIGCLDSWNTDFDDPAIVELHCGDLFGRDWHLGIGSHVTADGRAGRTLAVKTEEFFFERRTLRC
jgi:hypothetical protein